ncbi:hypothetical protein Salat_2103400 [Sesamum alatum]|uniref:Uncharacterized protein n=1 Tax=Sesamum alatum TaxID=300844 RepID=A0AAE1Y1V0_9LAMI|nr:hypothetical protein Salat_2103400 [Sesamum alatum]
MAVDREDKKLSSRCANGVGFDVIVEDEPLDGGDSPAAASNLTAYEEIPRPPPAACSCYRLPPPPPPVSDDRPQPPPPPPVTASPHRLHHYQVGFYKPYYFLFYIF